MLLPPRAGRRTNVALLAVLAIAFGTGVLGYLVGTPARSAFIAVAHALAGFGVVILAPWKSLIVRRAWRRDRSTALGAALLLLVVLCVAAGAVHGLLGWAATDGLLLQLHVGAAVCLAVLLIAHVVRHPQPARRVDLSRRTAVRALALGGGAALVYAATHGVASALALPGAPARATGSTEVGSGQPKRMPVTQWFLDSVPSIDATAWTLVVAWPHGERSWQLHELTSAADDKVRAVLDCTGGWYAEQVWRGVALHRLLPSGVAAQSLDIVSTTGYRRRLPLTDASTSLLATHVGGQPLSPGHGAPARLVTPGRRGFWWVKWVTRIEVTEEPWWLQSPFPLR